MNVMPAPPRVLFFGTPGESSLLALEALLATGVPIAAVVLPRAGPALPGEAPVRCLKPAPPSPLPLLGFEDRRTIAAVAHDHCIPAIAVGSLATPDVRDALAAFAPDLLCVACF